DLRADRVPGTGEQRRDLLRVERVHLTAVGADVEAPARSQGDLEAGSMRPRNLPEGRPIAAGRVRLRLRAEDSRSTVIYGFTLCCLAPSKRRRDASEAPRGNPGPRSK